MQQLLKLPEGQDPELPETLSISRCVVADATCKLFYISAIIYVDMMDDDIFNFSLNNLQSNFFLQNIKQKHG